MPVHWVEAQGKAGNCSQISPCRVRQVKLETVVPQWPNERLYTGISIFCSPVCVTTSPVAPTSLLQHIYILGTLQMLLSGTTYSANILFTYKLFTQQLSYSSHSGYVLCSMVQRKCDTWETNLRPWNSKPSWKCEEWKYWVKLSQ